MSSFDYIKTAIRQKGCTLQQVADASGMTKGYLSQLLNAKIKSPSAQKLEALHRFLGLEFPRMQKKRRRGIWQVLPAAYRAHLSDPACL